MNSTTKNQMLKYQRTLKAVADASGTALPYGISPEQLEQNIQPNTVYGIRCSDRKKYYRSVYLKPTIHLTLQVMLSNPVYGTSTRNARAGLVITLTKNTVSMLSCITVIEENMTHELSSVLHLHVNGQGILHQYFINNSTKRLRRLTIDI